MPHGIFAKMLKPCTIMSASSTMTAAIMPEAGSRTRASVPTSLRAICGPISPRKKKFPPKATDADDSATAHMDR